MKGVVLPSNMLALKTLKTIKRHRAHSHGLICSYPWLIFIVIPTLACIDKYRKILSATVSKGMRSYNCDTINGTFLKNGILIQRSLILFYINDPCCSVAL